MTKDSFAQLYRRLFAENKIKSKVDLARQLSVDGYSVGKAYIGQVLNPGMPDKGVSEGLEKAVYKVYKSEMAEIEKPATTVTGDTDVIVLLTELIRESREDRKMIIANQATITKTAQAAVDAAQTANAALTNLDKIHKDLHADRLMITALQQYTVLRFSELAKTTQDAEVEVLGKILAPPEQGQRKGTSRRAGTVHS